MAGLRHVKEPKEFAQAGIKMKTVRIRQDWMPKESMSFPYIRYNDIMKEEWEDSTFYSQIDHRFFTPVFTFTRTPPEQPRKDL